MIQLRIRCSAIGPLMTEPTAKAKAAGEVLSVGAKTAIRKLAAQEILGVEFEVSSKQMQKGLLVEADAIELLNRVRGLSLAKNTERRSNPWITGECDVFDAERRRGHDIKCSWSAATFPIARVDCEDSDYEFQMRGYMALWDADEWEVNYCLLDTPEHLIGLEPIQMHAVSHIPERLRLTTWSIKRDRAIEEAIYRKVEAARRYFAEVVAEFDASHRQLAETADATGAD